MLEYKTIEKEAEAELAQASYIRLSEYIVC